MNFNVKDKDDNNMSRSLLQSTDSEKATLKLAHDIASPLTVMQLNIRFIKDKIPEKNLSMMQAAINQIREITHAALNKGIRFSKIELAATVQQMISGKRYEWKEHPCVVEFTVENKKFDICANRSDIHRILSNILNNAYESLLENRNIFISLVETENHMVLCINDTGCGIPENKINSVLNGESLKISGHGLGLSAAREYMRSIDGDLILKSEEYIGTEVKLIFPKNCS